MSSKKGASAPAPRRPDAAAGGPPGGGAPFAPGPRSRALVEEEARLIAPGLQTISLYAGLAMESGRGARLRDVDGRRYLDFVAGIGVASLGHSHPEYVRLVSEQLGRLAIGSFTTARRVSFLKTLAANAPAGLDRLQFYSSGAEAVEAAVRLAKSRTKKFEVIGFWGGFHGKTGGVLGALGDSFKHELGPLMPGLYLSPYPNPYRCPFKASGLHDCAAHCLEFLRDTIRLSTSGALAALIAEPIQGTAGNVIPPPGFLDGLREIARERGALLIADEMLTGFGRTGRLFAVEHERIVPDIMTLGKGMGGGFPISGVLTSSEIAESKPFANPSGSSSSYGGNPLAAAAADAALSIILKERLADNAARVGASLLASLRERLAGHPWVGEVRGRGLMIGVDLVEDPATRQPLSKAVCRRLFDACLSRGLLTMAYNPSVRINPPLVITEEEALEGAAILADVLWSAAKASAPRPSRTRHEG